MGAAYQPSNLLDSDIEWESGTLGGCHESEKL